MTPNWWTPDWRRSAIAVLLIAVLLVCGVGLSACSSAPNESSGELAAIAAPEPTATTAPEPTATAVPEPTATAEPTATLIPEPTTDDEPRATPLPLRPAGEPAPTTVADTPRTSAYIARASMAADSIEVGWSDREGGAEYHIHRVVRTSDDEPGVEVMTAETRLHIADDSDRFRFVDDGVVAGTTYWHGVRVVSAEGDLVAHGWHRTAAVDDEEPPAVVDGITAVVDNGEVLITWTTPNENYQLHSYRVLRGVDGEPPEIVSQTWRLDQMSFIDDEPPTGRVVYQIVAMDFHWNLSDPGSITVDLP